MRAELYTLLLCLVLALAGCTGDDTEPRASQQSAPLATPSQRTMPPSDETVANCGSPAAPAELSVSERQAIQIAFGNRKAATCDRFETSLRKNKGGRSYWEVRLGPKGERGCEYGKGVYADNGELLPGQSAGCPDGGDELSRTSRSG